MTKKSTLVLVPIELIENKILLIRGRKAMLDRDLAILYGVKTHVLNQAVRRNMRRFPEDFMFQLNRTEAKCLISQFVISKKEGRGGLRKLPYVFTEQGVAMLSGILNSNRAIDVNIQIMRTFTKLREMLASNHLLRKKIEAMEKNYNSKFKVIFDIIKRLVTEEVCPEPIERENSKGKIGFKID